MYRIIAAVLLCAACGGGTSSPPSGPADSVNRGVQAGCPDPNDPNVDYVSADPLTCAAALFRCDAGQTPFDDACGCGCLGPATTPPPPPPPPMCPSASDPNVHYVAQTPLACAAALFQCASTQTTFNDACGCGCIGPVSPPPPPACPNPADPKVHYVSQDVLGCAAAFFQCTAAQTTFNDACGCGCID